MAHHFGSFAGFGQEASDVEIGLASRLLVDFALDGGKAGGVGRQAFEPFLLAFDQQSSGLVGHDRWRWYLGTVRTTRFALGPAGAICSSDSFRTSIAGSFPGGPPGCLAILTDGDLFVAAFWDQTHASPFEPIPAPGPSLSRGGWGGQMKTGSLALAPRRGMARGLFGGTLGVRRGSGGLGPPRAATGRHGRDRTPDTPAGPPGGGQRPSRGVAGSGGLRGGSVCPPPEQGPEGRAGGRRVDRPRAAASWSRAERSRARTSSRLPGRRPVRAGARPPAASISSRARNSRSAAWRALWRLASSPFACVVMATPVRGRPPVVLPRPAGGRGRAGWFVPGNSPRRVAETLPPGSPRHQFQEFAWRQLAAYHAQDLAREGPQGNATAPWLETGGPPTGQRRPGVGFHVQDVRVGAAAGKTRLREL